MDGWMYWVMVEDEHIVGRRMVGDGQRDKQMDRWGDGGGWTGRWTDGGMRGKRTDG